MAPSYHPTLHALETAGKTLGVLLVIVTARAAEDFEGAFSTISQEQVGGFLAVATPPTLSHGERLAELALKHRLPSMFGSKENVEAGGLISYAPDLRDIIQQAEISNNSIRPKDC